MRKVNKVQTFEGTMSQLKSLILRKILLILYHSFIHIYVVTSGNLNKSVIKHILQKQAGHILKGAIYNSHRAQIFKPLNLLRLQDILEIGGCKLYVSTAQITCLNILKMPINNRTNLSVVGLRRNHTQITIKTNELVQCINLFI